MKKIYLLFMIMSFINAQKLEVTADKFTAKDVDKKVVFEGNAHIIQAHTSINANKIVVHFDDSDNAKSYYATGKVLFRIKKAKADYRGKCNNMTYLPTKQSYILRGHVRVKDKINNRDISGDKIYINAKTGGFSINGVKKKQAKLIFDMQ